MFTRRQQQTHPHSDNRTRIIKARQEAEALFTSKRPTTEPSVQKSVTAPDQSAGKPRILTALPTAPIRYEQRKVPVNPDMRMTPKIAKTSLEVTP